MVSVRKALSFAFLDRYASLAVTIGSSMVLARLLAPAEVGLWSITMMLLAYASTFRDLGTGQYVVRSAAPSHEELRSVWAVQLGIGVLLALLIVGVSGPVARFYGEPRLVGLLAIVALDYALNPFGALSYAWWVREMRFETIAAVRFASSVAGAAVSMVLALRGLGPQSLAWGSLASTCVTALLSTAMRPAHLPWWPGTGKLRGVVTFGSSTTTSLTIQSVVASTPELMLGKFQSFEAVGLFSRAYGLVGMINRLLTEALSSVALSWFSQHRREGLPVAEPFLKATAYVCALSWAACATLALLAYPVMRIMYGDQWDGAVDATRIIVGAAACNAMAVFCWPVLTASGATPAMLRATLLCGLETVVLVYLGAAHGLNGLAWALVALSAIGVAVWLESTRRVIGFTWAALGVVALRCAGVAACAAVAPALVMLAWGARPAGVFAPLVIGCAGAALGFLVGLGLTGHPLKAELERFAPWRRGRAA